jgi:cobalt-zinc-cadmium efflux system membrane fusion protein
MNRYIFKVRTPEPLARLLVLAALAVGLFLVANAATGLDRVEEKPGTNAANHDHDPVDRDHRHEEPAVAAGDAKDHPHDHGGEGHGGHADEVKLTPEAIQQYRVRVEPVKRRQLRPSFIVPARVSFNTEAMAHVGSAVKGRVTDLRVKVGDGVKKDDVLVVVESPELGEAQLDFIQKRAGAAVAAPLLEVARSALDRANKLYQPMQGITLTELQKRETEFKTAEANLRTAQTAAAAAEGRLRLLGMDRPSIDELARTEEIKPRFVIRAPIAGQVTEREVTLGELVAPERDHLLIVADMTTLWVLADVPEARLRGLKPKADARFTLAALPEEKLQGVVSFVSHTVDPVTRTAKVRIEVDNKDGELRPGMFGSVEITGGEAGQPVLAVPDEAVQTVEGGPAVFVPVEGEKNTFAKRAVTVAKPVGGWVPVLSGLKEGEPVVVAGTFILKADLGKSGAAHEH